MTIRTPRVMVALVAMTDDLPMPTRIAFLGEGVGNTGASIMSMSFRNITDGQQWSRRLGGRTDVRTDRQGRLSYLDEGIITWYGWRVHIHANARMTTDEPLSPNFALQLGVVANGDAPGGGGTS